MIEILNVDDFIGQEIDNEAVIAEGILDLGGIMLVEGPTEVGKSYFVIQMALDLAAGKPWLGRWSVERPFNVLLIQAEIGKRQFQTRLKKLRANYPSPLNLEVLTAHAFRLDNDANIITLGDTIVSYEIEVLILDPMRPFHTGDENSSKEMEEFFYQLKSIQARRNLSIVETHHERKPSYDQLGRKIGGNKYDARGSSLITDRPDTILRLSPTKESDKVQLTFEKLRNNDEFKKPEPMTLLKNIDTGLFVTTGSEDIGRLKEGDILALLTGQIELGELKRMIVAKFGVSSKTAEHRLNEMEGQHLIVKETDPGDKRRKLVKVML